MLYLWRISTIVGFVLLLWSIFLLSGEHGRKALQSGREFAEGAIGHPHWLDPVVPGTMHEDDDHLRHPETASSPQGDLECSARKQNLVLTSTDDPKWADKIFIFMQSLESAMGAGHLAAQRANSCPPAPVAVKILVPPSLSGNNLPAGFKALKDRYSSLEFVGQLPDIKDSPPMWLRRYAGYAEHFSSVGAASMYNKVLVVDLDVAFQRNPFTMTLSQGTDIQYFAEWHGLSIGQCSIHTEWFEQCAKAENEETISRQQSVMYMHRDRISDGATFGTARAVKVYLDTMAKQLKTSKWRCNSQATHTHLYYSETLAMALEAASLGGVKLIPNDEALFGNIGTTPFVTFNEWGEVLNEKGQVQVAIHQYQAHKLVTDMVRGKYGWVAQVGRANAIPDLPELVVDPSGSIVADGGGSDAAAPSAPSETPSSSSSSSASPSKPKTSSSKLSSRETARRPDMEMKAEMDAEMAEGLDAHDQAQAEVEENYTPAFSSSSSASSPSSSSSSSSKNATSHDSHSHQPSSPSPNPKDAHTSHEQSETAATPPPKDLHAHHAPPTPEEAGAGLLYKQYRLEGVDATTCASRSHLCSCKYEDCQPHYEAYCGLDRLCRYPVAEA